MRNKIVRLFLESNENKIRIFRALPTTTNVIKIDNYVTKSVKFALEHAENNHIYEEEPHNVVTAVVNKNDIRPADNPSEFLSNINVEGTPIYSSKGYEYNGWDDTKQEVRDFL